VLDIPPQKCITADNAPLTADAVVYWRIIDPAKAHYQVENLVVAIQNLVLTQLRAEVGKLSLDDTFSARSRINDALLKDLDVATVGWGVKVTRVEVRDIIPNAEILRAMESQMAAERTKRADVIKSEGHRAALLNGASAKADAAKLEAEGLKIATVLKAEAEREKLVHEAEGTAKAFRVILNAAGDHDRATQLQFLKAYIDAQACIATSDNAKVLMFPSTDEWASKMGAMFATGKHTDVNINKHLGGSGGDQPGDTTTLARVATMSDAC